jgi:hypothetical protein
LVKHWYSISIHKYPDEFFNNDAKKKNRDKLNITKQIKTYVGKWSNLDDSEVDLIYKIVFRLKARRIKFGKVNHL